MGRHGHTRLDRSGDSHRFDFLLIPVIGSFPWSRTLKSAGHGRRPNSFCASLLQHAGALRKRGSGRHDVVHHDHGAALHPALVANAKCVAHVGDTLFAGEADLRDGRTLADQHFGRKFNLLAASALTAARAINSAWLNPRSLRLLLCSGTGTISGRRIAATGEKFRDRASQHSTQHRRNRKNALVLQQMHQAAKAAFVFAEGNSARELRFKVTAVLAAAIAHQQLRAEQAIAANHALRLAHRSNGGQTFRTDRNPGNVIERGVAQPAIRGEEDGKNVAKEGLQGRENYGTLLGALTSPVSL